VTSVVVFLISLNHWFHNFYYFADHFDNSFGCQIQDLIIQLLFPSFLRITHRFVKVMTALHRVVILIVLVIVNRK